MQYFDDPLKVIEFINRKDNEKKQIKRTAAALGITYLSVSVISLFWAVAFVALLNKLGISQNWFFSFIEDAGGLQFVQILMSLLMFTIPFFILYKWSGEPSKEIFPLKKPEKGTFLPLILIGIGFCSFSNIANSISGQIFLNLGFPDPFTDVEYPTGIFGFLLAFLSTAIMPALVEEFAMRGVFMGILRKFGDKFALVTSAILFGLIHSNFQQIVFAAFVGLVLGFAAIKSGSLWTAILIHSLNNLVSVLMYYLSVYAGDTASNAIYLAYLALALVLGIVGMYMLSQRDEGAFKFKNADMLCREKNKYTWFFVSPFIIIAGVLTLVMAIFMR